MMILMIPMIPMILFLLLIVVRLATSSSSSSSSSSSIVVDSVHECCDRLTDSMMLMACARDKANANRQRVEGDIAAAGGPSLGVGIVTYSTTGIFDYSSYSFAVNEAYAEHNGYIIKLFDDASGTDDMYDQDDPRWNKVKILEMAIDPDIGWARDLDYVMWVDADLIFLDMNMRIEQIASRYPNAHILMSAENHGSTTLVNSGAILIRNSRWSRQFLSLWWSWSSRKHYSDQEQFDMLYQARRKIDRLDKFIAILPPDALNSDPPAFANQKDHNQVLHLMGEHSGFRIKAFGSAFNEICRYSNSTDDNKVLARQLTATRSNLLLWTLEEYGHEHQQLIKSYADGAEYGIFGISESRKLSNSIHHYAHALYISGNPDDRNQAANLRVKAFQLLSVNMEARRPKNEESKRIHGRCMYDWPEFLKLVAEAGQHLMSIGTISERRGAASRVLSILDEIYDAVHRNQKSTVLLMRASIHRDIALIEVSAGNLEQALENFELDLSISSQLATVQGDHILVAPYSMTANALAMMGRHEDALHKFDRAIELCINHYGDQHESLSQYYLNKGIALYELGALEKSKKNFERALYVYEINNGTANGSIRQRITQYMLLLDK